MRISHCSTTSMSIELIFIRGWLTQGERERENISFESSSSANPLYSSRSVCVLQFTWHFTLFVRVSITVTWKISLLCLSRFLYLFRRLPMSCAQHSHFSYFLLLLLLCFFCALLFLHFFTSAPLSSLRRHPFAHSRMLSFFIVPLNWATAFGWDSF